MGDSRIHGETTKRDPEDQVIQEDSREMRKEKMFHKTIADSFPASDPPSSLPDPHEDLFAPNQVKLKRSA